MRRCRFMCWRWICRRSVKHPGYWETRCARCGILYCISDTPFRSWGVKVEEEVTS